MKISRKNLKQLLPFGIIVLAIAIAVGGYAYQAQHDEPVQKQTNELVIVEGGVKLKDATGWTHQRQRGIDSAVGILTKSGISVDYDYGIYGPRPSKLAHPLYEATHGDMSVWIYDKNDLAFNVPERTLTLIATTKSDRYNYFSGSIRQTDDTAVQLAKELLANLILY